MDANSIDDLCAQLDNDWYQASDGSYSQMPTWGPKTDRVEDLIAQSGPDGDIVSWDTRSADGREHRYLMRGTNCDESYFYIIVGY